MDTDSFHSFLVFTFESDWFLVYFGEEIGKRS